MTTRLLLCLLTLSTALTACGSISQLSVRDPRCQRNQWCPYTDPPSPIRTEVIRSTSVDSRSYAGDPAVR